jgi:hypothetical protein
MIFFIRYDRKKKEKEFIVEQEQFNNNLHVAVPVLDHWAGHQRLEGT